MIKYIKIYVWQAISLICNFAALFVVTPFLSSNPALFGIYSIVTSAYLFLAYADFGFLGAGLKYASECYAKNDRAGEIKIIGFVGFVFLIFVVFYALIIGVFVIDPNLLVKNLKTGPELGIARNLLLILALFCPIFVFQRMLQIVFAVRLENYQFQKVTIVANIIEVLVAVIIFRIYHYPIVAYFFFSQVCTLLTVILGCYLAKRKLNYDLTLLFKSFRYSRELYKKTKKLAFSSVFITLSWIVYYELDPFVIGKLLGPAYVAIYAIGLTIVSYFRSLFGIMFTPFVARFNHFIGIEDHAGLRAFVSKILNMSLAFTVFPVIAVCITAKVFVFNLVGSNYHESVPITQALLLGYLYSFISYPAGIIIMAYERVKELYITSAILPVVYWLGILITFKFLGLEAFAYFKFVAFTISGIIYLVIIARFLKLNAIEFFRKFIVPALLPIIFIIVINLFIQQYFSLEKSKAYLMVYIFVNGLVMLVAAVVYYFSSNDFNQSINHIFRLLYGKANSIFKVSS